MSELIIALLDLLEVEARTARRGLVVAALAVGVGLGAVGLALGGATLALWALYHSLLGPLTRPAAALLTALAAFVAAGLAAWVAQRVAE